MDSLAGGIEARLVVKAKIDVAAINIGQETRYVDNVQVTLNEFTADFAVLCNRNSA